MLNLPRSVIRNGRTVQYTYDAGGTKLRSQAPDNVNTYYAGMFEYLAENSLLRIGTDEGQLVKEGTTYLAQYYLRDHLGNVRSVLHENGSVIQETEYYAFGLEIARTAGSNRYTFLGKERQVETNWIDLQARFYDPAIGRFMSVDPETEGQLEFSPYHYSFNNPIRFSDPDGRFACCGGPESMLLSEAKSQWEGAKRNANEFVNNVERALGEVLSYTDINDAAVIATMITRDGNAVNLDGQPASGVDKGAAIVGASIPFISGSAAIKGIEFIGERAVGAYKKLQGNYNEAHHIIQDAAVKDIPGYKKREAPTVHLEGSSKTRGSEHNLATETQNLRRRLGDGGTYGSERNIAYRSLRAAGISRSDAKSLINAADNYFKNLGVTDKTSKRIPYTRQ